MPPQFVQGLAKNLYDRKLGATVGTSRFVFAHPTRLGRVAPGGSGKTGRLRDIRGQSLSG